MLASLELLHYCRRFANTVFAFSFSNAAHYEAVLIDLRVIQAAGIKQVNFCAADPKLNETVERWNRAGERFTIIEASCDDLSAAAFIERVKDRLLCGEAPLVAIRDYPPAETEEIAVQSAIVECALALGARKVFFPGDAPGLKVNGKFRSYPTTTELRAALAGDATFNLSRERLEFLINEQESSGVDVIIIEARRGAIFEEVFTHSGAGTLLTQDYPNILRAGTETDVRDILAIMQPYISEGSLKPVTEEELLKIIRSFMVYSVNGQIVAAAALMEYGDSLELGKLCTLPRYQARGRARALVRALVDEARVRGKRSVFALTVQPYVAEFFERLGFKGIERESLPASWKAGYDFSRPSRAYEFLL